PREAPSEEQESKSDSPPSQLVIPTVVTGKSSTLSSRLAYSPDAPLPIPNKSQKEYVSSQEITRRWYYERVPSQGFSKDDEEFKVMRPPAIRVTTSNNIDSKRTRRMELRRLLYTTQFLMKKKFLARNLRSCCKKITNICTKALSTELDEQDLLHTLERARDTILEDPERVRIWETIRPTRQGLFELLNSKNRMVLEEVLESSPDVLLLYGNNLFLIILAVVDCEYKGIVHTHLVPLWQSVIEWELYQLGFKAQRGSVNSKYDLHSIYSNLMNRVRILSNLNLPEQALSEQQMGQIIWTEMEGRFFAWIIFQSEKGMVAGLVDNLPSQWLRPSWHQCVSDSQIRKDRAEQALYSHNRNTIVVTEVRNHKTLWILTEGEDGPVWLPYVFVLGTPQKKDQSIPWIKLTETIEVPSLYGEVLVLPILPSDTEKHVNDFLKEMASLEQTETYVTCEVTINTKIRVYELRFKDKSTGILLDTLQFKDTAELVRTLRHPIRKGTPLRLSNGSLVIWDHRTDISYIDAEVETEEKKKTVSLSLLEPLVYWSRFYPDQYQYPKTCKDLLVSTLGSKVTMVIKEWGQGFRIELEDLPEASTLNSLETVGFTSRALGLLTECVELFDSDSGTRFPMTLDVSKVMHKSFSKSDEHTRLVQALKKAEEDMHREEKYKEIEAAEGIEPEEEYLEPEYEEGLDEEQEYIEPDFEEGLDEEQDNESNRSASPIEEGSEEDEVDEEAEYLEQIKELEADPTKNFQIGYRYVKLAQCRSDSDLAIKDITKALELLEGCDHSDSGVVLWHVDALITRCELSVQQKGDSSMKEELGDWAKEMQDMYAQLLQMSAFGKDYPELSVRIQQLQENI
ncbi:MAG: hypothetical protein ACTSPB_10790, partial [Candidatus Thorarchaeota archaeon]